MGVEAALEGALVVSACDPARPTEYAESPPPPGCCGTSELSCAHTPTISESTSVGDCGSTRGTAVPHIRPLLREPRVVVLVVVVVVIPVHVLVVVVVTVCIRLRRLTLCARRGPAGEEPHEALSWASSQDRTLERA